ncbi:MAG TPA: glucose 1-dehydrogenase [Geminicoccaceae bacterium]|nr:glucose 1-dehydrogenase [Geminicoccus sp.]HMU51979.1 glucose 1-dehydrogenase [Geminicoccaceae bacterium]
MRLFDLKGRVAVVTGGNGGIGLGMAKGLAEAGASVVVAARNAEKNAAAVKALEGLGAKAIAVATDVTDEASVAALVKATVDRFGALHILVNNAGTNVRKPPQDYSLADWHKVIDTNLTSAYLCSHACYAPMKAAGGGKVVMIGSMTSIFGLPFASAYSATKGGIVQYGKALATAWAADNIQVNSVLPGWIDTDLTRAGRAQIQGLHERVEARTPAARWGTPEDFAGIAVFLSSAASDFITGASIVVDGGFSSQG